MGMLVIIIALINRIAKCFDAANRKIFDGKLGEWLVSGIETVVAKLPSWWQELKGMHRGHFRIMKKYNPKSKKREQTTSRVGAAVFAYLAANMYLVSAIFFLLTLNSIYLEFSIITLLGGLLCTWCYFQFGEIYRADAYNNAVKAKINLAPWQHKES